jgi:hypothetical protein
MSYGDEEDLTHAGWSVSVIAVSLLSSGQRLER